jgi:hypothetical protein
MGRTVIRVWDGITVTEVQKQMIRDTRDRALIIQTMVASDMGTIWGTRRRRRLGRIADFPNIRRWIGMQTKHRKLRRVNRRTRKLRKWLDNRRIIIVVHPNSSAFFKDSEGRRGYSRGPRFISPVLRIHISQNWLDDTSIDSRAANLIHELCHEMGMPHGRSDNDNYCEVVANAAGSNPQRVIKNPLTYQGLFLEYTSTPINCP